MTTPMYTFAFRHINRSIGIFATKLWLPILRKIAGFGLAQSRWGQNVLLHRRERAIVSLLDLGRGLVRFKSFSCGSINCTISGGCKGAGGVIAVIRIVVRRGVIRMQAKTVLLALIGCITPALADDGQRGLVNYARNSEQVDVIVRFKASPDQSGHRRFLNHGAVHKRSLALVGADVYTINSRDLDLLAADPDVEYIGLDHEIRATSSALLPSTPDYGWMTVLGVSSPTASVSYDGTGVGVAVIDSGLPDNTNDLQDAEGHSRIVYKASFIPNVNDANDQYGHATMVAGLIGGNGKNSTGTRFDYTVRGIAPNVNIVSLRVLDKYGASTDSTVISAIQAAIALQKQYNIRVINLSLGRPVSTSYTQDPLCQAVQQAWNAGIVVVVAAGNDGRDNSQGTQGYATINAPGNSPDVITVGAMNTMGTLSASDDKITSYSSKGPTLIDHVIKPDLVAPGNRIVSIEAASGSYLVSTYPNNRVAQELYQIST